MLTAVGSNSFSRLSGVRPARTSSTIRRRNSGGYGGRLFGIVVSFSPRRARVSTRPGQLQGVERRSFGDRPAAFGDRPAAFGDRPAAFGDRPAPLLYPLPRCRGGEDEQSRS